MSIEKEEEQILKNIDDKKSELKLLYKMLEDIEERKFSSSDKYVKCVCLECNGQGNTKIEDRRIICPVCNGKGYMWVKKWDQ